MQMSFRRRLLEYPVVTLGSLLVALGLILFLVPNKIAAGGVSGLATVTFYVFHWPVGMTMLLINIPLFIFSLRELGLMFGLKSIYGAVALSLFTDILSPRLSPLTRDPLLATLFGGVITGIGLGMVFRAGGTTGGTDLAAQLVRRYLGISVGRALLFIDGAVIVLAGLVFSIELALYALVAVFVTSRMIDAVQEGEGYTKVALIISDYNQQLTRVILDELQRGATLLEGRGAYTGTDRPVLMVVLNRAEVTRLKVAVADVDPRAFITVANVQEVMGEGFHEIIPRKAKKPKEI